MDREHTCTHTQAIDPVFPSDAASDLLISKSGLPDVYGYNGVSVGRWPCFPSSPCSLPEITH